MRDPTTKLATSSLLEVIAGAVVNLDTDPEVWQMAIILAKEELLQVVTEACSKIGEGGLHTAGFQARAQELTIRIEILEELVSNIHNNLNGE